MAATHISIADLADRIRNGERIILDADPRPIPLLAPLPEPRGRLISEVIASLHADEIELGHQLRMGSDFADDVEEIVGRRKPRSLSKWD